MKTSILIVLFLLPFVCRAQKVTQIDDNTIRIKGNSTLYFDAEQKPITRQAHADSLKTHKYIISIKGTDEKSEIHLTYKHPRLETLIGKSLPLIDFSDINGKTVRIDESDITVLCFWNRHCSPCILELTALNILAEEYSNVRFIALTPDSREEVSTLMKKLNLEWQNITIIHDYDEEFADTLHVFVYPSSVIIDKSMIIKEVTIGGDTRKLLRTLEKLSGEN